MESGDLEKRELFELNRTDELRGYVKENKKVLERIVLYSNPVISAMALTLLYHGDDGE